MSDRKGTLKALGPGFLFAAVSVGVSHLVQSTRAGAGFGFSLMWVIIVAMIIKYPLVEFGQRYAAATGHSLLEGYRRQGKWSLVLYLVVTIGAMFTVLAAVTAVTAGLAIQLFKWNPAIEGVTAFPVNITIWSLILIGFGVVILAVGRYPLLDKVIKVIMVILAISTIAAFISVLPRLSGMQLFGPVDWGSVASITFVVGLVGWMPTGLDVSVWQSFWALARKKETGHAPTLKETLFDFNLGYIGTGFLAIMFCTLGAAVMFREGAQIPDTASAFAANIIELYTSTLGPWSFWIIAIAAFTTMYSTTLTVLDGFPRALQLVARRFIKPEDPAEVEKRSGNSWDYWAWIAALSLGAMLIIIFFLKKLTGLIDVATIISFITGPFLGILTYRAMTASYIPEEFRPCLWRRVLAISGIVFLIGFLLFFAYFRIFMVPVAS